MTKVGKAESEKSERSSAPSSDRVRNVDDKQESAREIRSLMKKERDSALSNESVEGPVLAPKPSFLRTSHIAEACSHLPPLTATALDLSVVTQVTRQSWRRGGRDKEVGVVAMSA